MTKKTCLRIVRRSRLAHYSSNGRNTKIKLSQSLNIENAFSLRLNPGFATLKRRKEREEKRWDETYVKLTPQCVYNWITDMNNPLIGRGLCQELVDIGFKRFINRYSRRRFNYSSINTQLMKWTDGQQDAQLDWSIKSINSKSNGCRRLFRSTHITNTQTID